MGFQNQGIIINNTDKQISQFLGVSEPRSLGACLFIFLSGSIENSAKGSLDPLACRRCWISAFAGMTSMKYSVTPLKAGIQNKTS
jgi:hypothetical protein